MHHTTQLCKENGRWRHEGIQDDLSHKINLYLERGKCYKEDEEHVIWVMCMWLGKMQKAEIKGKGQAHHGEEGQGKV